MELYQLRYFLEVARQKNITRAAIRLGIAQTALSEQVKNLETEFGTQLVIRGRRESTLTSAGQTLATHAAGLLTQAEAARDAVTALAGLRGGRLAVASIPSVSACLLPPVIAAFRRLHPQVEILVMEDTSTGIAELVETGRAEVGIAQLPISNRLLQTRALLTEPFAALLPIAHPFAKRRTIRLQDLAGESFVLFKGRAKESALAACRAARFEPRLACESSELETVRALVASGLGVAIIPLLGTRLRHPGTIAIPLTRTTLKRDLAILTRRKIIPSPAAAKFTSLALEAAAAAKIRPNKR